MSAPVADFIFTPAFGIVQQGPPGLFVEFTDKSQNSPASWSWQFDNGDGTFTTSTDQNPSHSFTATGATYGYRSIILTVSNVDGSDTKKVGPGPNAPTPGGVFLQRPRV